MGSLACEGANGTHQKETSPTTGCKSPSACTPEPKDHNGAKIAQSIGPDSNDEGGTTVVHAVATTGTTLNDGSLGYFDLRRDCESPQKFAYGSANDGTRRPK